MVSMLDLSRSVLQACDFMKCISERSLVFLVIETDFIPNHLL